MKKVLVTGAGGFIGGHWVRRLLEQESDISILSVDLKPKWDWFQHPQSSSSGKEVKEIAELDLRRFEHCREVMRGVDEVYNFAADMGGMGFISARKLDCMMSVLINTHLLEAAAHYGRKVKYFFASSACVYPAYRQASNWVPGLKEEEAYPAQPEDGYGWEKLFSERMTRHFAEDFPQISVRIARFHNVYGPWGTYEGGREKAPAALCRKFAEVAAFRTFGSVMQNPERERIEIWGDGKQTRSFLWIADCLDGLSALMHSDWTEPINIGSEQQVSIDQLVDLVEVAAGFSLPRHYCKEAPQGVRGRTSDNSLARKVLKWEPCTDLGVGIRATYNWILTRVLESKKLNKC